MNSWAADICLRWLKWLAGGLVWGFRMSLVRELVGRLWAGAWLVAIYYIYKYVVWKLRGGGLGERL